MSSLKSRDNINEKVDGPDRGFCYLSFISDPINLEHGARDSKKLKRNYIGCLGDLLEVTGVISNLKYCVRVVAGN